MYAQFCDAAGNFENVTLLLQERSGNTKLQAVLQKVVFKYQPQFYYRLIPGTTTTNKVALVRFLWTAVLPTIVTMICTGGTLLDLQALPTFFHYTKSSNRILPI